MSQRPDRIQTIEQAMQDVGEKLAQSEMTQRARNAVEAGEALEITIVVSPMKQGAVVTMHSLIISKRESHGQLIRLE